MPQQIIEINQDNLYISLYRGFLLIENKEVELGRIPLDDIISLLISANQSTISKNIIATLAENNIPIIFCDAKYLPISITLPFSSHYKSKMLLDYQINTKLPLKKRLWQEVIKHKITNQARVLKYFYPMSLRIKLLENLATEVKSGDSTFTESQAAKIYFKELFGDTFKRNQDSIDIINIMLNYGYSILRSAVARSLCGAGLHPALGIFHKNNYNPFCLVDDIMEVYRPLVDYYIKHIDIINTEKLSPKIKQDLAKILWIDVIYKKENIPLYKALNYVCYNVANSFKNSTNQLNFASLKL